MLAHSAPLWRQLAGSRIFITGGTGFFGIWLLESIAAANDALKVSVDATVLSRDPQRFLARMPHLARRTEFDWLCGHPATFSFPNARHDYLLHLATATSAYQDRTDPVEMLKTKLFSISHVLDYARHANIRRMLVTSSGAVYGPQPAGLSHIPETYNGAPDTMKPASAYGEGKRLVEQMCALAPKVDTVIARCFSFLGPHLPLNGRFAAGNFLRDALTGDPIVIHGSGRSVRSYLHAADLTVWLLQLLSRGRARTAYNVGSDRPISILELAQKVAAQAQHSVDVLVKGNSPCVASQTHDTYVPDTTLARNDLLLTVRMELDEALKRTMAWELAAIQSTRP